MRQSHFGFAIVVAPTSPFYAQGVGSNDTVAPEQANAFVDKPGKADAARRAGEERRHVGNDRRSSLDGFVVRGKASDGGVK